MNEIWPPSAKHKQALLALGIVVAATLLGFTLAGPAQLVEENVRRPGEIGAAGEDGSLAAQGAPSVSIAMPSSGVGDFGASQGNVWDMDSVSDIVWTQPNASGQTITLSQPAPGIVRGQTPEGSDLAVAFYANPSISLPSAEYHHLTYKLKIAAEEPSCRTNSRIIYTTVWPNWLGSQEFTHAILPHGTPSCQYGSFCTYYMDLSSNSNSLSPTWFSEPPLWPTAGVKAFAMWAHERWANCGGGPDFFDLDFVYLTGDIVARAKDGYQYTLKWLVSDPDGGTITSTVKYQQVDELQLPADRPLCNSGNFNSNWTLLTQRITNLSPPTGLVNKVYLPLVLSGASGSGSGSFNETYAWDLSNDTNYEDGKSYYVCIEADDGTSRSYAVSSAPVIRVPNSPVFSNE
jgi:hypothetical protein